MGGHGPFGVVGDQHQQWPVTDPPGTAGDGVGSKATPIERMSWVKA